MSSIAFKVPMPLFKSISVRLSSNYLFLILTFMVFAAGICLRSDGILSKALEYDEIWTLESYAGATNKVIFTDLALPNNHPLNSLLIKYSIMITGSSHLALGIRLNSFVAGILTILLTGIGAYLIAGEKIAGFFAILFTAFSGGLIHYSQTGRGYSLQTFLIVAFVVGLIFYQQRQVFWNATSKGMMALLLTFIAILAILTLPTSILFLFPVCCLYLLNNNILNRERTVIQRLWSDKYMLGCFLLIGLFALYWYLNNFSKFRQGQVYGSSVNGVELLFNFATETLTTLCDWKLLLLIMSGLAVKSLRGWIIAFLLITGFVIISALIFKAGPARTYLPLIPLICMAAACAVVSIGDYILNKGNKKLRFIFFIMAGFIPILSFSANFDYWQPPDCKTVFNKVKNLPNDYYLVYPLNESYPLWFNNKPGIIKDIYDRAMNISGNSFFVSVNNNPAFQGKKADGSQQWINVPAISQRVELGCKNLQCHVYRLRRPEPDAKLEKKVIVAYISIQDLQSANAVREFLWRDPQNEWMLLNEWLNCPFFRNGRPFIEYVMISEKNRYLPSDLSAIETKNQNNVLFYYLDNFNNSTTRENLK